MRPEWRRKSAPKRGLIVSAITTVQGYEWRRPRITMSNCISPKHFMVSPFAAKRRTGVELMDRPGARLCGNIVTEAPVSMMKLIVFCPILVATSNSCELSVAAPTRIISFPKLVWWVRMILMWALFYGLISAAICTMVCRSLIYRRSIGVHDIFGVFGPLRKALHCNLSSGQHQ